MKKWFKRILILLIFLISGWIVLRATGLKFFKIPTRSMENAIPMGSRIMVWNKNFKPERFEIIVYHNPDYDTVLVQNKAISYYTAVRMWGQETVKSRYTWQYVPLGKREHFVGRCVGLPGDKLIIINGQLYVNGKLYENDNLKEKFALKPTGSEFLSKKLIESKGIDDAEITRNEDFYQFPATKAQITNLLKSLKIDTSFYVIKQKGDYDKLIFPYSDNLGWNSDQFGEIQIPQKGVELNLTLQNLPLYRRLIESFERNNISVNDNVIFINNNPTDKYVPKKDYYFIINDNRDNSFDSRYWGFLPEDHISGKVLKIFK